MKPRFAAVAGFLVMICFAISFDQAQAVGEKSKAENQRVKALFDAMHKGEYKEFSFPKLQLTDVPALLERAESTKRLTSFPVNPISSFLLRDCSEGTVALWLAEGVRKGGKFPSLNPRFSKEGVNAKTAMELEAIQMEMAKAYRAWWEKAKLLAAEDAMAIEPLKDTGLSWR